MWYAGLLNGGFEPLPRCSSIVLALAGQHKDGIVFDLPIALGVLVTLAGGFGTGGRSAGNLRRKRRDHP